jgi:methionyl-tRNA formyltransferase
MTISSEIPQIKVLLAGAKTLSCQLVEALANDPRFDLVGVVPSPDDSAASVAHDSIRNAAATFEIPIFECGDADAPPPEIIKSLGVDVLLSVFFSRIFKRPTLQALNKHAVNVHFGLLPEFRGNRPIPWAMILGEQAGFTVHVIDEGIDSGPTLKRVPVDYSESESARTVYARATETALRTVPDILYESYAGHTSSTSQSSDSSRYFAKGDPFDLLIDWTQSASQISRFISACSFPPFPGARGRIVGKGIEFSNPKSEPFEPTGTPGRIVEIKHQSMLIECGDSAIQLSTESDISVLKRGDQFDEQLWDWKRWIK